MPFKSLLLAGLLAGTLLAVAPAAQASDPSPPFRSSSDPGGYPLHGVHQSRLSKTIVASAGLQYRKHNGVYEYRRRYAVQGDGRYMTVRLSVVAFREHGYNEFWACMSGCYYQGTRVVVVGTWHRIRRGEDVSTDANIRATYFGGKTTGIQPIASYRMQAPYIYPVANPVSW